ncbi:MAG: histidine phosphatase family protein [Myxococcota bacterium]|nr:histidine phosphatase family protein [Myxococcota bacterium]
MRGRAGLLCLCTLLAFGLALESFAGKRGQALKPRLEGPALLGALQKGGYVILMRHTSTEHVAPDPAFFDVADCDTQRNLSEQGRSEAKRVNEATKKLGIRIGDVLSSPYCRCLETGRLAFGRAEAAEILSVFDRLPPLEKEERGAALRKLLGTKPAQAGTNTVLITHTGTLLYTFGLDTKPEGVAHVFEPGPAGIPLYVGKLEPGDWLQGAGVAASP